MRLAWLERAMSHQLPPVDEYKYWLQHCGRGAGKTETGSQESAWWACSETGVHIAVIGPRFEVDVIDTMFTGQSGIIRVLDDAKIKHKWLSSRARLTLPNGSIMRGMTAEEPEGIRGPNVSGVWGDEPGTWAYGGDRAMENAEYILRLAMPSGRPLPFLLTGTPNNDSSMMVEIYNNPEWHKTSGSTFSNPNLDKERLKEFKKKIGKPNARAELLGEFNQDELLLLPRSRWQVWGGKGRLNRPKPEFLVLSYDTALGTNSTNDYSAMTMYQLSALQKRRFRADPYLNPSHDSKGAGQWITTEQFILLLIANWRMRVIQPTLKQQIVADYKQALAVMKPHYKRISYDNPMGRIFILIEGAPGAIGLAQELQVMGLPVQAVPVSNQKSKYDRVADVTDLFTYSDLTGRRHQGLVYVLGNLEKQLGVAYRSDITPHKSIDEVLAECAKFTKRLAETRQHAENAHDDYVDTVAQACQYARLRGWLRKETDVHYPHLVSEAEKERLAAYESDEPAMPIYG